MNALATVHIWERDNQRFRLLLCKSPFTLILQEAVGGMTEWVTVDTKMLEEFAHEGLETHKLWTYDILQVFSSIANVMQSGDLR